MNLNPQLLFINIDANEDYSPEEKYASLADTPRLFCIAGSIAAGTYDDKHLVAVTAEGFPEADFDVNLVDGLLVGGTNLIVFPGQVANIIPQFTAVSFADVPGRPARYNLADNETRMLMNVPIGATNISLSFVGTNRYPGDTASGGTGIGKLRVMRADTRQGSNPLPEETLFNPTWAAEMAAADGFRFMDFLGVNHCPAEPFDITVLPKPTDQSQATAKGGCIEHAIKIAYDADADAWINIHHTATEEYVRFLARAIMYGTDGANAYGSPQLNPVWPGLRPGRKARLEYSNETWNSFNVNGYLIALSRDVKSGTGINFDGGCTDNELVAAQRGLVANTVWASGIFREEPGNDAMGTTIRFVLGGQQLNPGDNASARPLLGHLAAFYNDPAHVVDPHPPAYHVSDLAVGGYVYPNDQVMDGSHTVDQV